MRGAPPDTLFVGGRVFTARAAGPISAGVAVRDGKVAAVAPDDVLRDLAGPRTDVVDLAGGLLTPGFQDAHVHPVFAGALLLQCDLQDAAGPEDLLRRVSDYAGRHPDRDWVVGGGWSMEAFPGGRPHREALDAVVADRPVYLTNRDGHAAWVNTAALRAAGVHRHTPDPQDGRIRAGRRRRADRAAARGGGDARGGPAARRDAGRLAGRPARRAGPPALARHHRVAGRHCRRLPRPPGQPGDLPRRGRRRRARRAGGRRPVVGPRARARADPGAEGTAGERAARPLRPTTVKIMQDGVAESFTAAMTVSYRDACGCRTANSGLSFVEPELLRRAVTALDADGFQVHLHTLGDRAVREALDALAAARAAHGRHDWHHHLAHLQVVYPDDVPRFAELDVTATVQPLWAVHEPQMDELTIPFLGEGLAERQYPFADLHAAGAHLAAGSDWAVSSADPWAGLHVAVNRVAPDLDGPPPPPFLPEQRLSLATALTAYTRGSARVNRLDDVTGTVEVGKDADLVVHDRDPFTGPPERIGLTRVLRTYVQGRLVHEADDT